MSIVVNKTRLPVTQWQTESGSVVSISDARKRYAKSLSVALEPIQSGSGDPSPDNIRPISGRSSVTAVRDGKNLLDFSAFSDLSNWRTDIATSGLAPTTNANKGFILPVKEGSTYTLNLDTSTEYPTYLYLCASVNGVSTVRHYITTNTPSLSNIPKTFTVQSGEVWYIRMGSTIDERNFSPQIAKTHSLQLELGSATAYEPYQGTSITVSLGQTVYGGTVDLVSGVMRVTNGYLNLNTANMNNNEDYPGWRDSGVLEIIGSGLNVGLYNAFTNISPIITSGHWAVGANTRNNGSTLFLNTLYFHKSQTEWQALAMDVQFVIPLATPQTIQLSPNQIEMLMRNNTIWSDDGIVTVNYARIRQ